MGEMEKRELLARLGLDGARHLSSCAPNHAERNSDWHGATQLSSINAAARLSTFLTVTSRIAQS
jgi:hypothetical protein